MYILGYGRLSARIRSQHTRMYQIHYRATQVMHNIAMDVFKVLVPAYITESEFLILAALFLAIRLGVSPGFIFILIDVPIGLACFSCLKFGIEFAATVTELSRSCSWTPFLKYRSNFTKEDRTFLKSCATLKFKVGETFTISRETFPTMSQQIILNNLVNLLVTFRK